MKDWMFCGRENMRRNWLRENFEDERLGEEAPKEAVRISRRIAMVKFNSEEIDLFKTVVEY